MARTARLVVPGYPHHVTQRGNRDLPVFFGEDDYRAYQALLAEWCARAGTEVWAYCLMPNHVHLVMVPSHADGLRAALGEAHRRYTRRINLRQEWSGHLWQGRFASFPMDESSTPRGRQHRHRRRSSPRRGRSSCSTPRATRRRGSPTVSARSIRRCFGMGGFSIPSGSRPEIGGSRELSHS